MIDQYTITPAAAAPVEKRRDALRPALWFALFLFAGANAVISTAVGNPFISSGFGVATLSCAVALIVHHYRHRA